jgi:hypothetical protein
MNRFMRTLINTKLSSIMDRWHRWHTHLHNGKQHMSHLSQYDSLSIDKTAVCDTRTESFGTTRISSADLIAITCKNLATHIGSNVAREFYACDECAKKYISDRHSSHPLTWYCLTFDEVEQLDNIPNPMQISFTRAEAINVYQMNSDLYTLGELEAPNEVRFWFILIDARVSRAFFRIISLAEIDNFKDHGDNSLLEQSMLIEKWKQKECLVLFAEPYGKDCDRTLYKMFLPLPSTYSKT